MSLVVFPFKHEDPAVVRVNLDAAASHPRVEEVWAVAAEDGAAMSEVADLAHRVANATGKTVEVFAQQRIGKLRSGKGDGMNTAIAMAAVSGHERIHFYDADITNFGPEWIEGAEAAADEGYAIVRHRFPRAATDAMVTWMITRPALAMTFPGTALPRIGQPLGGELLITSAVARNLAANSLVGERSDWGVDTMITYATSVLGLPMYEHEIPDGKRHALYGSLAEIRQMVLECLDAAASLRDRPGPPDGTTVDGDPPGRVPDDLKRTVAYDRAASVSLLTAGWSEEEIALAATLPEPAASGIVANRDAPSYVFMDEAVWGLVLADLIDRFRLGDQTWEALAFRLWLARVLAYTEAVVSRGYDEAIAYLEGTIRQYETGTRHDGAR